ncbi:MAG: hypothetical protein M3Q58_06285 [Bacteroidota bacterium]|nr:hypothetical protein [Bacteroidota bacterium]
MPGSNKFLIFFFPFLIVVAFHEAQAQAFKKGSHYLNTGLGIGGYNSTTQIGEKVFEKGAGSLLLPINYEYGLLNQVGMGLQFQRGRYFFGDTARSEKIISNSFLISNTLHFLNNEFIDLYFGISYGLSSYNSRSLDKAENEILMKGLGFSYFVYSGIKVYFTSKMGIFIGINYNNLSYEINTYQINYHNQFELARNNYNINYTGINIQGGFAILLSK